MRIYTIIAAGLLFVGCKTAQPTVAEGKAPLAVDSGVSKIIEGHYADKKEFNTLSIKASAKYKDDSQTQSVTADIRILKDQKIFISVRFLGITMAKALITPSEVKYYEKINSTYFEGNYAKLSQWLGTELDFAKVQNLLIGRALDDLNKGSYRNSIENNMYKLENTSDRNTHKAFWFETENYLVKKENIAQAAQNRSLQVDYPAYSKFAQAFLPSKILLEAIQPKGKTNITIEYDSATFDGKISFPYEVPEGYERVDID